MASVGIRELKQNASAVVAAAQHESVTVTDRGRPVARLTSLAEDRLQQLLDEGRVRPARASLVDLAMPTALEFEVSLGAELVAERAGQRY